MVSASVYDKLWDEHVRLLAAIRGIRDLLPHRLSDLSCGRDWSCGCVLCARVRAALKEIDRS